MESEPNNQTVVKPAPPTSAWDAFEHIILFISLYIVVSSISIILHAIVNKWVPGLTAGYSAMMGTFYNSYIIRGALAALIVAYPFFAFLFLKVSKRTNEFPSLRTLRSRKFLIYLTLIITFLIGIGNIIRGVYSFISGEISLNFILNLSVTLLTSGSVFFYYLTQVKEDRHVHV